jgi:hypothetical protein
MTHQDFQDILDSTLGLIGKVMDDKSKSYMRGGDKLHNFKRAAKIGETTPAKALLGMKLKHDVSILDIVDDIYADMFVEDGVIDEKIGDAINYLILLKAVLLERRI